MNVKRVLVTGSRGWTDRRAIEDALQPLFNAGATVLVSGAARGADKIAEGVWELWGGTVERHPAQWDLHGRSAGVRRNALMVDLGADVCVGFILNKSRGATDCVSRARHAGIPIVLVERP